MSEPLKPCPFCGGEAEIERAGDRRQSCIVTCTDCGCRHESPDEGERSGSTWNDQHAGAALFAETQRENDSLKAEVERLKAERDAVLGMLVDPSPAKTLWDALLPDSFSPLGFAWSEFDSEGEARAAILKAAGGKP